MKTAIIAILCLGATAARDLDGDGVEDAAADGDCCAAFYGANLADCNGATTLADAQGCCASGWLLRYNIGSDGVEDQTQIDCISFVAEADCTENWFGAGINCPHFVPTWPPSPTGGLTRDLDGDGYEDAAPAGECCVSVYGSKFDNEYGCGTTLAEVQAGGCCPEDFIARYSLQPDGESQNGWDCVSFVDKDGCTEKNTQLGIPGFYQWSADVMGPGYCPHTVAALDTLRNIQGCGTCAEDLHDGRCGVFWLETGRWKDWAVLGMEEIGCQKDTCCASSSSACCKLNVSLVAGLACGALVFILCCVALCCFACAGCPAYKARHKHAADSKADAPPPLVPIPKADVRVEVPYGYEGAGAFAAEEEEVPAEAVLAAERPPPAQSWAPELEQELEPEC